MVLVLLAAGEVAAQKYYIPRFKKTKIERDYELEKMSHKWAINLGGSYNVCMGMQNMISYNERGDKVNYPESMSVSGGSFYIGAGYRFNENFIAGLEGGFQLQDNSNSIPLYASLKYYHGKAVQKQRYRWFNYLNAGPQFYLGDKYKVMGGLVAAGGGLRVLAGRTLKMDVYMGYQLNICNRKPSFDGKFDYPEAGLKYRQLAHLIQVGVNVPLW